MAILRFYEPLALTPRPALTDPGYHAAVHVAANELRAAQPWLLVQYPDECERGDRLVASRRTLGMLVVTWLVNLWRRPRRWWLWRLKAAYIARNVRRAK